MPEFSIMDLGKLTPKAIEIEHLYLDPNNPRFMGVESSSLTPKDKFKHPEGPAKSTSEYEKLRH